MKTPLYEEHERLGAKIVDFHGWEMPVWYTGIKHEHMAVRSSCGLFDVSHMGEIYVDTKKSVSFLDRILTRDIYSMKKGKVLYTFLLNESGGIIDDLTVYCIEPGLKYMLCVNASNTDNDFSWIRKNNSTGAGLDNKSSDIALLALQGPRSDKLLKSCLDFDLGDLRFFSFSIKQTKKYGELMISQTGYTGAGGVEIFMPQEKAALLWKDLLDAGAVPCGLGARDTLRLEMGYPLHGNDIDETTTPVEAGLGFALDMKKQGFIGKDTLSTQIRDGIKRHLTGFVLKDKGIPRQGCSCFKGDKEIGVITSGSISPVLDKGIAMGYVNNTFEPGEEVDILVRSRRLKALITRPPFVEGAIVK